MDVGSDKYVSFVRSCVLLLEAETHVHVHVATGMHWNRRADNHKTSAMVTLCFLSQQSNTNAADCVCSSVPSDARPLGEG